METLGVLLFLMLLGGSLAQNVVTPDGPIKGTTKTNMAGRAYSAFYSIPYAQPPIGGLRFKAPQPVKPWTEVYDASVDQKRICYQLLKDYPEETEDCLVLNVYVPHNPNITDLPVLFFIHGGGFVVGSGLENGPEGFFSPNFLVNSDVIFVTINFRLGVFGFLSTGDEVIPGNNGLKDQVLALKWVQRNIAAFGGDPSKVVISGVSAGGASVGYLLLNPTTTGLYRSAILESGSPLSPWAYQRNQVSISYKTASFIDTEFETSRDSQKLLETLQSVDSRIIDAAAYNYTIWDSEQPGAIGRLQLQQGIFFAPVIEVWNEDAFITEYPYTVLENGNFNKVPIMIGTTSDEGLLNIGNLDYILQGYDADLTTMVPKNMHMADWKGQNLIASEIKNEYSPDEPFIVNKLGGIEYFTEHDFTKSIVKHAEFHSAAAPTYFYMFSYSGEMGNNTINRYPGSGNVSHDEEVPYIYSNIDPSLYPESDQIVHNRLMKLWLNFVIFLNPTPEQDEVLENVIWPSVWPNYFQYLNIVSDLIVTEGKPKAERMAFWDKLYETYGVPPFDTF